jgi:DNA primase catalytic subunit
VRSGASGRVVRRPVVRYTTGMSKRLQVVVREDDLQRYERSAQASGQTLSEWVRQAMNVAERERSSGDVEAKLAVIRKAATYNVMPEVDIDTMLAEIDTRYDQDLPGLDC